jgi:hypothetical protein
MLPIPAMRIRSPLSQDGAPIHRVRTHSLSRVQHSCNQRIEVNYGPRSEVIVSGTPKCVIQVKVKAFAHAAADVSERGIASDQSSNERAQRESLRRQCNLLTVLYDSG